MISQHRFRAANTAFLIHLLASTVIAVATAALVFGIWFPGAYRDMAGGTELFLLIISIDTICGPLLTCVLFDPAKSRRAIVIDLGLVGLVQLAALLFGLWTAWQVRPLYLSHELDRFKVVTLLDLRGADTDQMPESLQVKFLQGPMQVSLREPKDSDERQRVTLDALSGGADFGERPDFFLPFDTIAARNTLLRAKNVEKFLERYPLHQETMAEIAAEQKTAIGALKFLPVKARNDWIAVLSPSGQIVKFVQGDGF